MDEDAIVNLTLNPYSDDLEDLSDDISDDEFAEVVTNSIDIELINTNFVLQEQIVTKFQEKVKNQRGPYNNNRRAVKRMIQDRTWFLLNTQIMKKNKTLMNLFSQTYNIKKSTLYYYKFHLKSDPYWFPKNQGHATAQRVFSKRQEEEIADTLCDLVDFGVGLTQGLIREIVVLFYRSLKTTELHNPKITSFNCSRKFLTSFLKRIKFARRRAHLKKRPAATLLSIEQFRQTVKFIIANHEYDHILNADETFWRCADQSFYTWAPIGSDNIHIYTPSNEKAGFTALATVNFLGNTLPLVLVGKGKTNRCEKSQFGFTNSLDVFCKPDENEMEQNEMGFDLNRALYDLNEEEDQNEVGMPNTIKHVTTHSPTGWVNNIIWKKYLHFLRDQIPYIPDTDPKEEKNTIFLLCDGFRVHHNDDALKVLREHMDGVQMEKQSGVALSGSLHS